jgi:hypothetical protein
MLNIFDADLKYEETLGLSVIRSEGYNMVNLTDTMLSPFELTRGVRAPSYDKIYCFNKKHIQEINYHVGCHNANPTGNVSPSSRVYKCRHYKYLHLPYMIKRHGEFAKRMNPVNKKHGWGGHYLYTPEEITKEFNEARKNAIVV